MAEPPPGSPRRPGRTAGRRTASGPSALGRRRGDRDADGSLGLVRSDRGGGRTWPGPAPIVAAGPGPAARPPPGPAGPTARPLGPPTAPGEGSSLLVATDLRGRT